MTTHPDARAALRHAVAELLASNVSDKDLRMATHAIRDLSSALEVLSDYQFRPKATIFGSARLRPESSGYQAAYRMAQLLAERDFVVVTGGGPGVMEAGLAGAGDGQSVGIAIELPFETVDEAAPAKGWPLARQQMFFTRKLALVRNVQAVIGAPGGFGTLDEVFEVLTLLQTGKAKPMPVVLLETDDNPMWSALGQYVSEHLVGQGVVDPVDEGLYVITRDPAEAVEHIAHFWSNYRGLHVHGDEAVLMVEHIPGPHVLEQIRQTRGVLGDILVDHESPALRIPFDKRHWADLRRVIDAINNDVAN